MKPGKSIVELAQELARRASAKKDLVADTRAMRIEVVGEDKPAVALHIEGVGYAAPLPLAHQQIGQHAGIPSRYYDRMLAEAPGLLADNLNHWFQREPARRMVRTLDNRARAFLSDRYRRIDNEQIAEAVLPELLDAAQPVEIVSSEITDLRLYIQALFPRIEGEVQKGDVVQAGIVISNSEVGLGAFQVRPLVYRLVCTNGMIAETGGIRRNHVGRRVESNGEDASIFQDDTLAADDRALALKMRDAVRDSMNAASFGNLLARMREATEGPRIEKPVKAVEVLQKAVPISQGEGESILERLIRDGDYSRWGMLNAITHLANDDAVGYDRAVELQQIGGRLLTLNTSEWHRIAVAA